MRGEGEPVTNYVLVHGAFHGGWCWSRVAGRLRAGGHNVFAPTQTGLGERRHLASKDITIDTFVADITGVLEAEELNDVVLVGHSFAGATISGVADRMPERIRHLVYLDSRILEAGQSIMHVDARCTGWLQAAKESSGGVSVPCPPAGVFAFSHPDDLAWVERRLTPHPAGTFISPLELTNPDIGNGLPRTYVACTDPIYPPLLVCHNWALGREGWGWAETPGGHDAMVTQPEALARLLMSFSGSSSTAMKTER